jgi:hypothetical protein
MVNLLNMNAKVIYIIKLKILTLILNSISRVYIYYLLVILLGPLVLNKILVIKIIISNN